MFSFGTNDWSAVRLIPQTLESSYWPDIVDWATRWRTVEIINRLREVPVPEISLPISFDSHAVKTDFQRATVRTCNQMTRALGIGWVPVRFQFNSHDLDAVIHGAAPSPFRGTVVNPFSYHIPTRSIQVNALDLVSGDSPSLGSSVRRGLAHEVVHADQYHGDSDRAIMRALKARNIVQPGISATEKEWRRFGDLYVAEYGEIRYHHLVRTPRTDRALNCWVSFRNRNGWFSTEYEAHLVDTLVDDPHATKFPMFDRASNSIVEKEVPPLFRDPERFRDRFLRPRLRDLPFRLAYGAVNSRFVMGGFRTFQFGCAAMSIFDLHGAIASLFDPGQDKVDATLSLLSSTLLLFSGYCCFKAQWNIGHGMLRVSTALGFAGAFFTSVKHFYDDRLQEGYPASPFTQISSLLEFQGMVVALITGGIGVVSQDVTKRMRPFITGGIGIASLAQLARGLG